MKNLVKLGFVITSLVLFSLTSCQKEPSASFSASKTTVEVGETVTFTNATLDGNDFDWNFGDGQTSTSKNPTHSYTSAGTYTVTMNAYSKNGKKQDNATGTITVKNPPTKCYITKITFTKFKEDDNGYYWDSQAQGYYPDIYFVFEDEYNNQFYNAGSSNRIENVTSAPFNWSWSGSGLTFDLNKKFYVRLYDYDSTSSDDDMGACGGIKLIDYRNYPYPTKIDINCTNMAYTLTVNWTE